MGTFPVFPIWVEPEDASRLAVEDLRVWVAGYEAHLPDPKLPHPPRLLGENADHALLPPHHRVGYRLLVFAYLLGNLDDGHRFLLGSYDIEGSGHEVQQVVWDDASKLRLHAAAHIEKRVLGGPIYSVVSRGLVEDVPIL